MRPNADLHNKVAPHRSIKVPSLKILSSLSTYEQNIHTKLGY